MLIKAVGTGFDSGQVRLQTMYPSITSNKAYRYSPDGDIIFSVSKDHVICAWFSVNGERLGTYKGHVGALWTCDVDPTTTFLASGGADNTMRLWEVKTGKMLKTWDFPTAIKRVEFSQDGKQLLAVMEQRSGHTSAILVYDIVLDVDAEQSNEHALRIITPDSRTTVAGFSYLAKYIIACHEDGTISQYDGKSGELVDSISVHEAFPNARDPTSIRDLQWSPDRTYFITASQDKTAKVSPEDHYCRILLTIITVDKRSRLQSYEDLCYRHTAEQRIYDTS
jgi:translation initiation factor 3 subunit I